MWKSARMCNNHGEMETFHGSNNNRNSGEQPFNSTRHLKAIVDAHAQWIMGFLDDGWDGYLFSVMFNNLPGKRTTKIMQMHQGIERLYNRLATRMVKKPRSPEWAGYLPIGIFIPDFPVPMYRKGLKSTIADVSINDGMHMHGIVIGNKWGKMRIGLHEHFKSEMGQYLTDKLRHVDVQTITHDSGYVVEYALKSLVKRTASPDEVLVLNWGGKAIRLSEAFEQVQDALRAKPKVLQTLDARLDHHSSCPNGWQLFNLASVLQKGRETANIHAGFGLIRGILV
jgi:hypothetical protein